MNVAPELMRLMDHVQAYFTHALASQMTRPLDTPGWGFVGIRTELAVSQLLSARQLFPDGARPRFLDCGSGLSFVTAIAHELGFDSTGIEYHEDYVALARQLFPFVDVIQGDVLQFTGYGDFDVIYYYGPFSNDAIQREFEQKVEAEAKPGALILANRKRSDAWRASDQFEVLAGDGFMGVILRKAAAAHGGR